MKKLSTVLSIIAALGILVVISFGAHSANPRALRFLPESVSDFMTDFPWITWIGSALVIIGVLGRIYVQSVLRKRGEPRRDL